MKTEDVLRRLRLREPELRQLGVDHLFLFGSTVRGEATAGSDVDLFFDYTRGAFGVFELMEVKDRATAILGQRTDIMSRDSLHKALRDEIEASAVRVF